jgi:hypothetical protein
VWLRLKSLTASEGIMSFFCRNRVVEELVVVTLDYHLVVGVAFVVLTLGGRYPHFDVWVQVSLTWRR